MSTVVVPLKFSYPARSVRFGKRESTYVSEDGPVALETAEPHEAPLVGHARCRHVRFGVPLRVLDGALMRPVFEPGFSGALRADSAFLAHMTNDDYPSAPSTTKANAKGGFAPHFAGVRHGKDVSLHEGVKDGGARESALAAHRAFASRLRVIGGEIWRPTTLAWSLVDGTAPRDANPYGRYRLRLQFLDYHAKDADSLNPMPGPLLPIATFDPHVAVGDVRDVLRDRLGRAMGDVESPDVSGSLALDACLPETSLARLNPWLFGMSAWAEADGPDRSWASLAPRTRVAYAEAVANAFDLASGRLPLDEATRLQDAFARDMADDPMSGSMGIRARAYLVARDFDMERPFEAEDVACLAP